MKIKIASYLLVFGLGAIAMRYFEPQSMSVKQEVVYKDRVKTIVKEVITEKPDGTKVTEKITDKTEAKDKTDVKSVVIPVAPKWAAQVTYGLNEEWSASLSRRVIGNVFVGGYANNRGGVGVSLLVTF